jgi:hypothetical protein
MSYSLKLKFSKKLRLSTAGAIEDALKNYGKECREDE